MKREASPVPNEDTLAETLSSVELTPGRISTVAGQWTPINGTPVLGSNCSPESGTVLELSVSIVGFLQTKH